MASHHGSRLAFLAEKWSGQNRTNRTGGYATVCACIIVFSVSYCAYFRVLYLFDLVAQLRAPASLEGGIIKGISGYKEAHSSARSSFVRLYVRLHSSFTPSCVLVQD